MFYNFSYDLFLSFSTSGKSWIEGGNGLSLFSAEEGVVSIGVKGGTVWSEEFSIDMVTSPPQGLLCINKYIFVYKYDIDVNIRICSEKEASLG